MKLAIFQTSLKELSMMQTRWASILNPVLALPTNDPSILKGVPLVLGNNVINHKLGRTPQGWVVVDKETAVSVYRSAPFNDLTLTLNSTGVGVISLMVF